MRVAAFLLSTLLVGATVLSQTAPCLSENDSTNAGSGAIFGITNSMPGTYGWQISTPNSIVVESIATYTGNNYQAQTGEFATLAIWDDVNGAPGQELAVGTFRLSVAYEWRGCNLNAPVALSPTSPYWIVLTEPGWSRAPIQSQNGNPLPMMRIDNFGGGWVSANAPEALKYRLYCGKLDSQGVVPFGPACPNAAGSLGTVFANTQPTVGNSDFFIEGSGFTPGALIVGVAGVTVGLPSIPLPGAPGCFVGTTADVTFSLAAGVGDVRSSSPDGHVELPIAIPSTPGLVGFYLATQFAALDLAIGTSLPFVTSNALQLTIY